MRKPQEHDCVRLLVDVACEDIGAGCDCVVKAGSIGTIVSCFDKPREAYCVEFNGQCGVEVALPILSPDQFEYVEKQYCNAPKTP